MVQGDRLLPILSGRSPLSLNNDEIRVDPETFVLRGIAVPAQSEPVAIRAIKQFYRCSYIHSKNWSLAWRSALGVFDSPTIATLASRSRSLR